jgi:hypothetical protein
MIARSETRSETDDLNGSFRKPKPPLRTFPAAATLRGKRTFFVPDQAFAQNRSHS